MKNETPDLFAPPPVALNLIDIPKRFRDLYEFTLRARQAAKDYYSTPKEPADAKKAALMVSKQREAELDRLLKRFQILPGKNCGDDPLILEIPNKPDDPEDWGPDAFTFPEGSNIRKARYNSFMDRIEVQFAAGTVYHYFNSPNTDQGIKKIFDAWSKDSKPETYFTQNIRMALPYKKIS